VIAILCAGAGDLLAVHNDRVALVEVKSTAGGPYEHFGPTDRDEMLQVAKLIDADAALWWWPPRMSDPIVYDASVWP